MMLMLPSIHEIFKVIGVLQDDAACKILQDIFESSKSRALVPYVPSCLDRKSSCPRALVL